MQPWKQQTPGHRPRARRPADLRACVDALAAVHRADGYPGRWPADAAGWLDPPQLIAAWVVEHDGAVLGHVAIVRDGCDTGVAALTGRPVGQLARLTRLFVVPDARGRGLGGALVGTAVARARRHGLAVFLDVVDGSASAIALYERLGWRLIDRRVATWTDARGHHPLLRVYAAP